MHSARVRIARIWLPYGACSIWGNRRDRKSGSNFPRFNSGATGVGCNGVVEVVDGDLRIQRDISRQYSAELCGNPAGRGASAYLRHEPPRAGKNRGRSDDGEISGERRRRALCGVPEAWRTGASQRAVTKQTVGHKRVRGDRSEWGVCDVSGVADEASIKVHYLGTGRYKRQSWRKAEKPGSQD